MSRSRAYRRQQSERVSKKRMRIWGAMVKEWKNDPKQLGRMRKSNFSCGCGMCKPWKHWNKPSCYGSIQGLRLRYRK
jgi:hypothetical protein